MMAFLGIYNPINVPGSYNFNWRTGRNSIIRAINNIHEYSDDSSGADVNHPVMVFSGNGGGKIYGQYIQPLQNISTGEKYRLFRIHDTNEPLTFYQFNLEGTAANRYIEAEFDNVQNVTTYSFKDEGEQQMYLIRDSKNFSIYGTGGFNTCEQYDTCIEVHNSSNFRIAGAMKRGGNENPPIVSMIKEHLPGGIILETSVNNPVERPILYSRGPLW
jgi:hypothetical protein